MEKSEANSELWRGVKKSDTVKVLAALEQGASVDARDKYLRTPLMEAAKRGNAAVISTLLEHDAGINAQDSKGTTPLVYALTPENTEAVTLLLKMGASAKQPDNSGDTPLKLLKQKQLILLLTSLFSVSYFVYGQLNSAKDKDLQRSEVIGFIARLYEVFVSYRKYEGIKELLQKAVRDDN